MISAFPVTAARGNPPPSDFAVTRMSGTSPKRSQANMAPVRANPVCTSSAIRTMPCLSQSGAQFGEELWRRNDESALTQHRLDDDGGNGFDARHGGGRTRRRPACRSESCNWDTSCRTSSGSSRRTGCDRSRRGRARIRLVGMSLAGERHAEQGAAVKGVFEANDRRAPGVGARDLYRVLDSLDAGVQEQGLLGEVAGREPVHGFGKRDVVLVGRDLRAGVQEAIDLLVNRGGHRRNCDVPH